MRLRIAGVVLVLLAAGLVRWGSGSVSPDVASMTKAGERIPVLVELFTSEGCSSCPPADRVLHELASTQPVPGIEIVAISEHVDYWNYIGWEDPFSSEYYSARQQTYATAFGHDTVYTPQMVVDGRIQFNGSDAAKARDAVARAARQPKAEVKLARRADARDRKLLTLTVEVGKVPPVDGRDFAEVLVAVTEDALASRVARGENAGRRLAHTAVAREIRSLGRVDPATGSFSARTSILMAEGWKPQDLKALVFVQERARRRILGAASIRLVD